MAFSSDGRLLAVGTEEGRDAPFNRAMIAPAVVTVWDLATGKKHWQQERGETVSHLAFARNDSHIVISTSDKKVTVLDSLTGKVISQFQAVHSVHSANAANRVYSVSRDGKWLATAVSFHTDFNDGKIPIGVKRPTDRNELRVWDLTSSKLFTTISLDKPPTEMFFSPDGIHLVTSLGSHGTTIRKLESGEIVASLKGVDGADSYSESGQYLIRRRGRPDVWDAKTGNKVSSPEQRVLALGSDRAVGMDDGRISISDARTGQLIGTLPISGLEARYNPRDGKLYVRDHSRVYRWNTIPSGVANGSRFEFRRSASGSKKKEMTELPYWRPISRNRTGGGRYFPNAALASAQPAADKSLDIETTKTEVEVRDAEGHDELPEVPAQARISFPGGQGSLPTLQ